MSKPIVFFSHSSKDRDLILPIKNKICKLTGNAVEIFMSSDGQSIPKGTNWAKVLEDALNASELMFVFVTPNSVGANWLYFESGFAYSRNIRVIPVGIGIDIKKAPPLDILQGYNITSEDGLNNMIASINEKFKYNFDAAFSSDDYYEFVKRYDSKGFENTISSVNYSIYSRRKTAAGHVEECDFDNYFCDIVNYLEKNNVQYAVNIPDYADDRIVVANGIKISCIKNVMTEEAEYNDNNVCDKIEFNISCYNFESSFTLFGKLLLLNDYIKSLYLSMSLSDTLRVIVKDTDCSSIVSKHPEFSADKDNIGHYFCESLGLRFRAEDNDSLLIEFNKADICAGNIIQLINQLRDIGLIVNNNIKAYQKV